VWYWYVYLRQSVQSYVGAIVGYLRRLLPPSSESSILFLRDHYVVELFFCSPLPLIHVMLLTSFFWVWSVCLLSIDYALCYIFKFSPLHFSVFFCMPSFLLRRFGFCSLFIGFLFFPSAPLFIFLCLSKLVRCCLRPILCIHFRFLLQNFLDSCPVVPSCVGFVFHVWGVWIYQEDVVGLLFCLYSHID